MLEIKKIQNIYLRHHSHFYEAVCPECGAKGQALQYYQLVVFAKGHKCDTDFSEWR